MPFARAPNLNLITKKREFLTRDLLGLLFLLPQVPSLSALSVSCILSPDQLAVNLVFAPTHDLCPDVQQSALLGEDEEFTGCFVVDGDTCFLCQAQVTV